MSSPRVLIVDDHSLFRAGVRAELEPLVDLAGEAGTVEEAEYRGVEAPVVGPRPGPGRQRAHPPDGVAPRRLEPLAGQPSPKLRIDLEQTNDGSVAKGRRHSIH